MRRRLLTALALLAAPGCDAGPSGPDAVRLLEPPPGSRSTAALARARVGNESRYVLAGYDEVPVVERRPVTLPNVGSLRVELPLPERLATESGVLVRSWVRVVDRRRAAELPPGGPQPKRTLRARPVRAAGRDAVAVTVPVPDDLRGERGALTAVGHALPARRVLSFSTGSALVPDGARLEVGYAVAEPGWSPGSPPVALRVLFEDEADGARVALAERRLDPAADPRDRRWFDASIDAGALAGRRGRFVFEAEALAPAAGASENGVARSFPLVSAPELAAAPARGAPRRRPDVVLISIDTLRAQSLSAYGLPRATSPVIAERIAAEGALVQSAVAPFPLTAQSHMSLMTGLEPCAHGVGGAGRVLAPGPVALAEALRAAGYRTAAFTENAALLDGHGFERGFDRYVENRDPEGRTTGFARETFEAALAFLEKPSVRPAFVFIHTYQVHAPYVPPRAYRGLFAPKDPGDAWAAQRSEYEREIRYTDDLLGELADRLSAAGTLEKTLLVLTSDHGEGFGEHGVGSHGLVLFDEALLVPLVLRWPGVIPAGLRVEAQVGLVDVAPTLLELLELPPLPGASGRSFAALLGAGDTPFPEQPVASEDLTGSRSVRTRRYKYYRRRDAELLFDLAADPAEQTSVADARPELLAEARAAFAEAGARCEAWRARHAEADAAGGAVEADRAEEVVEKLRSLGYLE